MASATPAVSPSAWTSDEETFTGTYSYYSTYDGVMGCEYHQHAATVLPVLYSIFFLFGFLGNSLVIWVIVCGARLRSMTDVCLLNLAVADLLLGLCLPFFAHQARDQWIFGDVMCKMVLGVYNVVLYAGIFFVTLMSIDRYLAIVHAVYAMRARTRSFGIIAATVTWLAAIASSFPDPVFLQLYTSEGDTVCIPDYTLFDDESSNSHFWGIFCLLKLNVLGLFVPFLIMSFCYLRIIFKLLHTPSNKKSAIRLVLAVLFVFLCCWVPYNVVSFFKVLQFLHVSLLECETSKAINLVFEITEAIAYSHCCLNPVLYVFVGEKFRKHLLRLINRTPCRVCRTIKEFLPQDRAASSVYSLTSSLDERTTAV